MSEVGDSSPYAPSTSARSVATKRAAGAPSTTSWSTLAVLAMIVTATPGTAWAELAADRSVLLLHVLSLEDEAEVVATIKERYERPLMEIFE